MDQPVSVFLQVMDSQNSLVENYLIMFLCIVGFYSCSKRVGNKPPSQAVDVLVAGVGSNGVAQSVAKIWKNGNATELSPGNAVQEWATAIFVSGKDVYVCGNEISKTSSKPVAKYWKNGNPVNLTDGSTAAYAYSIVISGTDIYVAGMETCANTDNMIAKFWKNGNPVNLTDGSVNAGAKAIAVSGNNVYVVGYEGPRAVYWKNSITSELNLGSKNAQANCIYLVRH